MMKRVCISFPFFVLTAVMMFGVNAVAQTNKPVDNDYWIVVPANYIINPVILTLIAKNSTNVRVKDAGSIYNVVVTSSGVTLSNPMLMIPEHKTIVKRAIHVWSLDSLPFQAELTIGPEESGEGTWCIPTNSLGMSYRIAAYDSTTGDNHLGAYSAPEFAIVATEDNTHITIDFPRKDSLAPITITMNAGEAYHVNCGKPDVKIDPTGTRVCADKRIAVFTGHANAVVAINGIGAGNALLEEMLPIESWGKLHMVVSNPRQSGDIFRFIANFDNTEVFLDGISLAKINGGEFYETIPLGGAHEIYSTKPIMVAKYTQSALMFFAYEGGASIIVIPPVDRYFDSTRFYQVDIPLVGLGLGIPAVIVVVPTAYINFVEFDGISIAGLFSPILNFYSPIQYSSAHVPISTTTQGAHTLNYTTPPSANPYSLYGYYLCGDGDRDEVITWNLGYRGSLFLPKLMVQDIDMGTLVCDTSRTMNMTVKNIGDAPLIISSASGLAGSSFTLLSPTFPDTMKPGDSVQLVVKFTSSTPGTYTRTLFLTTNEDGACGLPFDTIRITARKEHAAITSAPASYDFGNVTCQKYETIVTVSNVGTVDVQVTDKTFSQAGLSIVSPNLPATIKPGDTQSFTIRLDATIISSGAYSSTLHLVSQPCDLGSDFAFTANRKALVYSVSPTSKDFGITAVNKTSTGTFTFDNQSDVAVHIASAKFDNASFSVTTPFGQTVAPHSSLAIDFTCYPPDTLKYESTLTITIDSPCVDDRKVLVRVEGASVCPQAVITEVLGKIPGDVTSIPIVIDPSTKFISSKQIDLTVKYDPALLRSAGDPVPRIGTVSNVKQFQGGVSFTLAVPGLPPPSAIVADIPVQALLAPYAEGVIDVSASLFTLSDGNQIAGASCPVPFSLGHDCVRQDELKSRSGATIEGIYPNPSYTKTIVEIIAKNNPKVRLEVYDTFGRQVEVLKDGSLTDGKHEMTITTESYTTGIYFCRLIHNGQTITKTFNVER